MNLTILRRMTTLAVILALFVVMLGAYTRLTDAGLGCPDWPGCYGKMVLPTASDGLSEAQAAYPNLAIEESKAWTEMAHRYAAGTLGLLILALFLRAVVFQRIRESVPKVIPSALIGLVLFQALLGMWTVTLKLLPVVVMGHLLGGILIFSCLCYFRWQISAIKKANLRPWRKWIGLCAIIVFIQIALGGWVSSNYAGIACVGFPTCNGLWLPQLNLVEAFNLFSPVGKNYQGGLLSIDARISIQYIHRLGAIITALMVYGIAFTMFFKAQCRSMKWVAALAIALVTLQFTLGILNVVYLLPLWVAVAHNGMAALVFVAMLSMFYLAKGEQADVF